MNRYLARLRAVTSSSEGFESDRGIGFSAAAIETGGLGGPENSGKPIPGPPSKPSKPSSESFEGNQGTAFAKILASLRGECPAHVELHRWQQAVSDASRFIAAWGDKAETLEWSSNDLFGLHTPPAKPHPTYSRTSRYDCAGLVWLLQGRHVVALLSDTAAIKTNTGTILKFRRTSIGNVCTDQPTATA